MLWRYNQVLIAIYCSQDCGETFADFFSSREKEGNIYYFLLLILRMLCDESSSFLFVFLVLLVSLCVLIWNNLLFCGPDARLAELVWVVYMGCFLH